MKIVCSLPPNYEQICKAFPVRTMPNVCFVYGDTLYRPGSKTTEITYDLRVHESTHMRQQLAIGAQRWWDLYCGDREFRLHQEVEAYHNQYVAFSKPDREKHIRRISGDLSSPLYGNLISFEIAKQLIRTGVSLLENGAVQVRTHDFDGVGNAVGSTS